MSQPTTMKVVHQYVDGQSTRLAMEDAQVPVIANTDNDKYLIRVMAASPCRGELSWLVNFAALFPKDKEPVPCTECAGIVESVPNFPNAGDKGVSTPRFKVGDEVFFRGDHRDSGHLREYTVARESWMAHKPKSLDWNAAAATPLSALTAWQGIFEHGGLDPKALAADEDASAAKERNSRLRVLVTGASGSVGGWAVQLALAAGAGGVVALSGPSTVEQLQALGSKDVLEVVDYTKTSLQDWVTQQTDSGVKRECDIVFDCAGGNDLLRGCWSALADNGRILSICVDPKSVEGFEDRKSTATKSEWFLVKPDGEQLEQISQWIEQGNGLTKVDTVFKFDEFEAAFEKADS